MTLSPKFFIGIILTILTVFFGFAVISYVVLNSSLPEYEDEISTGYVKNQTDVYRDDNGIAYIHSANSSDAAFAMGYVHAQERLFQMDIFRRAGLGRLSEVMGEKTIKVDKLFRTLGFLESARQNFNNLSSESKSLLKNYCEGINLYIKNSPDKLGVEFNILGYRPELWKPVHCLLISKLLAWELNMSWRTDIIFTNLVKKLGKEKAIQILPEFSENAPYIINENITDDSRENVSADGILEADKLFREITGLQGSHIGSNNWVVNGMRSFSGKPMIANDPHLSFSVPGKWYVASVNSPEWKADGFTIPGLPLIVIGKNQNIAWAVTNVMADDSDFYYEHLDSTGQYYYENNILKKLTIIKDTIKIKNRKPLVHKIKIAGTRRIVNAVHDKLYRYHKQKVISFRWTALESGNEFESFLQINKAADWNDFRNALSKFTAPGQNFIYADASGNIGYICAAKLPVRNNNSPTFITEISSQENNWQGFVPYEEMPFLYNPVENFIATANNKTKYDFPYHISNFWEPTSRIERIRELINSRSKLTKEDFKSFQNDYFSYYAKNVIPYLLDAYQNARIKNKNLRKSLEIIKKWNFIEDKNSPAPALFEVFLNNLIKNTYMDEMGKKMFEDYIVLQNVPYRSIQQLLKDKYHPWFDVSSTSDTENRDWVIRKSFIETLEFLEKEFGDNIQNWRWGNLHKVTLKHIFSGELNIIDKLINIGPHEIGGSGTTVFNTEYEFNNNYDAVLGPSMKFIYDFGEKNSFEFIMPAGQSGHILSSHYKDMNEKWLNGYYIKVRTDKNFVKKAKFNRLTFLKK